MSTFFNISATAFLIADPSRAAMLTMLMDGRAHPAGVLARAAGVSAQTASAHLAKLRAGGLVLVETEGRHRYYRLADSHVAQALEQLAAIRPGATPRPMALSPQQRSLQFCRRCYDHLAGQVAVAVTCALLDQDYLQPEEDRRFIVTPADSPRPGAAMSGLDGTRTASGRAFGRTVHEPAVRARLAPTVRRFARRRAHPRWRGRTQGDPGRDSALVLVSGYLRRFFFILFYDKIMVYAWSI